MRYIRSLIVLLTFTLATVSPAQSVNPDIFVAAKQGDQPTVEKLFAAGVDVNQTFKVDSDKESKTVVEYAALSGNLALVQWLLEHGAKIDASTTLEGTLLHQAVRSGNLPLVEWLVALGLDLNADNYSGTPLHLAVAAGNQTLAEWLLQHGANINANLEYAGTALHQAAKAGNLAMVEFLVKSGADINIQDKYKESALQFAFLSKNLQLVRWLVEQGADVNQKPEYYGTPLVLAAEMDVETARPLMEFLLAHGANLKIMQGDIFVNATYKKNQNVLQWLVEQGTDVKVANSAGNTALHVAAGQGNLALAQWLLEQGADVQTVNTAGQPPLYFAVSGGSLEMVQWLLDQGASINIAANTGETLMHAAASSRNVEMIEWVAKKKFDVNAQDAKGYTPLINAARSDIATVQALLARRANPNLQSSSGETALLNAAYDDNAEIVTALLKKGAKVDLQNAEGETALWRAITYENINTINALLAKKPDVNITNAKGKSVFMHAITEDYAKVDKDAILDLLVRNADVNAIDLSDDDRCPIVNYVVREGHLRLLEAMIKRKLNVNASCTDGTTALHVAAKESNPAIVEALINQGADVNARTSDELETPLHHAVGYGDGNRAIAELLINNGADINAVDKGEDTPLSDAISYAKLDVIDLLLSRGAQDPANYPALQDALKYGKKDVVEVFLKRGIDVNIRDEWNRTPLLWASDAYDSAVDAAGTVQLLIDHGADVRAVDNSNSTALHNAATAYGSDVAVKKKIIEILLGQGAVVDAQDNDGDTPLMNAAYSGHREFIEVLLAHNANINTQNKNGWTPLHEAMVGSGAGQLETIRFLLEKNADINATDTSGATPLAFTERITNAETRQAVVALLQEQQGRTSGSPEEQLSQLLASFKGHSENEVLRNSIINLVQGMETTPAVPTAAIEFEGQAQYVFKNLQADQDLLEVAKFYLQAIEVAPWVASYYYNLCLILEKTPYYNQALHACKTFLTADPFAPDSEIQQVQALIGGLEYARNATVEKMKLRNLYQGEGALSDESLYVIGGTSTPFNGNQIAVRLMVDWQSAPPKYQVVISCLGGSILLERYDLTTTDTYSSMCGSIHIVISPEGIGYVDISDSTGNTIVRTTLDELFQLRADATGRSEIFTKFTDNGIEFYTALVQGGPTNQYIGFAMYKSDCNGNLLLRDARALPDGFVTNEELLAKSWFDMNYLTSYDGQVRLDPCADVFGSATGFSSSWGKIE